MKKRKFAMEDDASRLACKIWGQKRQGFCWRRAKWNRRNEMIENECGAFVGNDLNSTPPVLEPRQFNDLDGFTGRNRSKGRTDRNTAEFLSRRTLHTNRSRNSGANTHGAAFAQWACKIEKGKIIVGCLSLCEVLPWKKGALDYANKIHICTHVHSKSMYK